MLLIIENNQNIQNYFNLDSIFLDTSELSLYDTLVKLKEYQDIDKIYFPLELLFENCNRTDMLGFDLYKHIRLTPDLGNLQFASILLGYSFPLETILRDSESTILCSPATYLFNLRYIRYINDSPFWNSNENLNKEILTHYVLFSDIDELKSEHDRRNVQGPLKLEREIESKDKIEIKLELWQKKLIFLQPELTVCNASIPESDFKNKIRGKRILYLDDEADKWENPLKKIFDGSSFSIIQRYDEIKTLCSSINQSKTQILEKFKKQDDENFGLYPIIEKLSSQLRIKQNELNKLSEELQKKKVEINLQRIKWNDSVNETQILFKEYGDRIASFLLYDTENLNDSNIIQEFLLLSGKLKIVQDNKDTLRKFEEVKINTEEKFQIIQKDINQIKVDLGKLKINPLNVDTEYIPKLASIFNFDLVILDLRLNPISDKNSSEPSGIEVLRTIKGFNPHIPVILFTSSQSPQNRESAKKLKVEGYWEKNVSSLDNLKSSIYNNLTDTSYVQEIFWKSELILNRTNIEKYLVSDYGNTIERQNINSEDKKVLESSLSTFIQFSKRIHLQNEKDTIWFWTNTGKLNEARFVAQKKSNQPEIVRTQLIKRLNLPFVENEFNKQRNNASHINTVKDSFDYCKKYIDYSIDWFLKYLPKID